MEKQINRRLLYLSTFPLDDVRAFSGSNRRMFFAFQKIQGYEVDYKTIKPNPFIRFFIRLFGLVYRSLFRHDFQTGLEERYAPSICRRAASFLRKNKYDGVICWQLVFGRLFEVFPGRRVFFSDATYHKEVTYYGWRVNEDQFARNDRLQTDLLINADLIMLSNHYYDDDLANYYNVDLERVKYFHFFPTLFSIGPKANRCKGGINAIIVAKNYYDKGIPTAIEAIGHLNRLGIDSSLTVIGFENIEHLSLPFVHFMGFVPQKGARSLASFLTEADLFILPTHHDCSPLVIPEANSFSVPVIAYKTGGISDYIIDGVTGYLIPEGSPASAFADAIHAHLIKHGSFDEMGASAKEFQAQKMSESKFLQDAKNALDGLFSD